MGVALVFWFLGPILGVLAVVVSIYLSDCDMYSAASFKQSLPELYLIALSISSAAIIDGYEFVIRKPKADVGSKIKVGMAFTILANVLFSFFLTAFFAKSVITLNKLAGTNSLKCSEPQPHIIEKGLLQWASSIDSGIARPFFAIVIAVLFGFMFRYNLEYLKQENGE